MQLHSCDRNKVSIYSYNSYKSAIQLQVLYTATTATRPLYSYNSCKVSIQLQQLQVLTTATTATRPLYSYNSCKVSIQLQQIQVLNTATTATRPLYSYNSCKVSIQLHSYNSYKASTQLHSATLPQTNTTPIATWPVPQHDVSLQTLAHKTSIKSFSWADCLFTSTCRPLQFKLGHCAGALLHCLQHCL